jgi:hypothetical protein
MRILPFPHLLVYPHRNIFFLRKQILKAFTFPLAPLGHPALYNRPLLRSVPARTLQVLPSHSSANFIVLGITWGGT